MDTSHLHAVGDGDGMPGENEGGPGKPNGRATGRARPGRGLPSDRIKFDTQVRMLTTLGRLSGSAKRPVRANELGQAIGMSGATAALCNRFFHEVGWLERVGRGEYAASNPLLNYVRQTVLGEGDAHAAAHLLAGPMRSSWVWQAIGPVVAGAPISRSEALVILAQAAGAEPHHRDMLTNVIEWLAFVGLVDANENTIRKPGDDGDATPGDDTAGHGDEGRPEDSDKQTSEARGILADARPQAAEKVKAPLLSPARSEVPKPTTRREAGGGQAGIVLSFRLDINWTADDMAKLTPEQIKALYEAMGTLAAHAAR